MYLARMMDCLDPHLCDLILDVVKRSNFWDSLVLVKDAPSEKSKIRTSSQRKLPGQFKDDVHDGVNKALLDWSHLIAKEYRPIHQALKLPGVTGDLATWREEFQLLKYDVGEKYDWHVDASTCISTHSDANTRLISVVLYLNDDFIGGETQTVDQLHAPAKGKALIFPSNWNYVHRACPVFSGTKYALVTWYHIKL